MNGLFLNNKQTQMHWPLLKKVQVTVVFTELSQA